MNYKLHIRQEMAAISDRHRRRMFEIFRSRLEQWCRRPRGHFDDIIFKT